MVYNPVKNIGGKIKGTLYWNLGIATYWNYWRLGVGVYHNIFDGDYAEFIFGNKYEEITVYIYLLPVILSISFNWSVEK